MIAADGREYGRWLVNPTTQLLQADISALPRGQYFVKMNFENGTQQTLPLLKQ